MKPFHGISLLLLIVMVASMFALQMNPPQTTIFSQPITPPKVKYFSIDSQSSPRPSIVSVPKNYEEVQSHPISITTSTPFSPPVYETISVNPLPPPPVPYMPSPSHRPNPPPSLTPSRSAQETLLNEMHKPYLHNTNDYTRG